MFVKICGITSASDALVSVALGADAIGFIFAPSKRQLAPGRAAEIVRQVPPEILTVGVFRDEAPERIVQIVNKTGVRAVQLHGGETPEVVRYVKEHAGLVIKALRAGTDDLQDAARYRADAILVDAPDPGSGQVFDWSLAEDAPAGIRVIMAGGLTPANVTEAITKVRPWGVDVASGVEASPGVKDVRAVRDFVSAAKAAYRPEERPRTGVEPFNWEEDPRWR